MVNGIHFGHADAHIPAFLEHFSEREGNVAGIQSGGGHLVEQWLELMVIDLVDQQDLEALLAIQLAGQLQAGEACSDDQDLHDFFCAIQDGL
jgi:hypothetical protein